MTRTIDGPATPRTGPCERAIVLAGFAAASLCTAFAAATGACPPGSGAGTGSPDPGAGIETVAAAWLAAAAWAFVSSLALALRRGIRRRDWRAFGRYEMTDSTELIDWSTKSGAWFDMALAEENERLMRGD